MGWYFVPKDWEPSEALLEWTRKKGLTQSDIEDQLESFRDHQYRRPKMDADRCWRNWVRSAIRFGHVTPVATPSYRRPDELTDAQREADQKKWEADMKRLRVVK